MRITRFFWLTALFAIAGCEGEGVTKPPPTDVKVFNAAPNVESIIFRREEDQVPNVGNASALGFGQGERKRFDSGPYEFNLDYTSVSGLVRADTFNETLSPELDYIFVAISPGGQPEVLTFTADNRPDDATPRVTIVHAFEGLSDLDVYMEMPGTLPVAAAPRGTIGFTGTLTFEIPPETYKLYLTTAGDPNDVIFESTGLDIDPEESAADREVGYVIADPAGQGTAEIVVFEIGAGRLPQIGLQSSLRVVHGFTDRLDRDFYLDETTTAALFPAQPFGVVSAYTDVSFGPHDVIVTQAGNPGTEDLTEAYIAFPGVVYTLMASDTFSDDLPSLPQLIVEDKRSITGQATLSLLDAAGSFEVVSVFVEAPGTDIANEGNPVNLLPPGFLPRRPLVPGDYEITVENPLTGAILAGPLPITLDDGGVYGLLIVDAVGGSTVDLVLFDDFVP